MDAESPLTAFLRTVHVGDVLTGTVTEITRSHTTVLLDGFPRAPIGVIGALDRSWRSFGHSAADLLEVGGRVAAEVIDLREGQVWLSRSATENPDLWAYLKALRPGERLSGTVAAIENFGVFVDLDDAPGHPVFPGVGFITIPELSWSPFEEAVSVGQHITCEFIIFTTHNGEARLSLRATQPDPFQPFARHAHVGQILHGPVVRVAPFGVLVRVADGVEGLIPDAEAQVGDELTVVIAAIDPLRRRLTLSRR
ncbi:30S ribosomal protein S1 [Spongiactinospora rosea]|uniref:30S ribosomal protein S1 n=1 Tax=Spongiactinospora rosea TaxID=2248750 RepID=A0A366M6A0_9ACTN|nr:S1 RNA-binding domain-containing protein [Spongiactinospora rosea]RBQ21059.1 30S ribosomal protein S1 [Spongiactinospora rosea]